ncbi:MAG: hypothetical protein QXV65_02355 [Candidatus Bathyarchaeia archaeon]
MNIELLGNVVSPKKIGVNVNLAFPLSLTKNISKSFAYAFYKRALVGKMSEKIGGKSGMASSFLISPNCRKSPQISSLREREFIRMKGRSAQ